MTVSRNPRGGNGFNLEHKSQKVFGLWQFHETPEGKNGFSPRYFQETPEGEITSENTNNHDPYEKIKWTETKRPFICGCLFQLPLLYPNFCLWIFYFLWFFVKGGIALYWREVLGFLHFEGKFWISFIFDLRKRLVWREEILTPPSLYPSLCLSSCSYL